MTQLDFLSSAKAAARGTDPETSHLAAQNVEKNGTARKQRERVLAALRKHPGCTSAELAVAAGMDRHAVARRLPELEPHQVYKGSRRTCTARGSQAYTWHPVHLEG